MCAPHNKIVDDEATRDQFPVEMLQHFKQTHEARARNSVVRDDIAGPGLAYSMNWVGANHIRQDIYI